MSLLPRLLLAIVAALFGLMMFAIAPPDDKAPFFYAFGAFCLAIAMACICRGRLAAFFASLVALGILVAGAAYFVSMLLDGPFSSGRRSQPSLLNALSFIAVFGLPCAAFLWNGRFGLGRKPPSESAAQARGANDAAGKEKE